MGAILPDCAGFNCTGNLPMHLDLDMADLGEFELSILVLEARFLREGDTVVPAVPET